MVKKIKQFPILLGCHNSMGANSYAIKMWTIFLTPIFSFLLPWRQARARSHVFCLFLNNAHASAKRKLWRYFLRQTFYTGEGVIPETSDNFTLKFSTRNINFLVLITSY